MQRVRTYLDEADAMRAQREQVTPEHPVSEHEEIDQLSLFAL